ncbi:MAG: CHAT domain-containing protein [Polyangiaceae bacterium]
MAEPQTALAAAERLRSAPSRMARRSCASRRGSVGRALAKLGRAPAASEAFEQAELALDDWARTVRVGQGREGLSARLDTGPRTWLSFLAERAEVSGSNIDEDRLASAALRALSRWFRTLSPPGSPGRRGGSASGAEGLRSDRSVASPAPSAGELWLLFHPLERDVLGIGWSQHGIRHVRISLPEGDGVVVAGALVNPFRAELGGAERVRLVLHRSFAGLPVGAVEVGGRALAEAVSLEHGLGFGAGADRVSPEGPPRALVVLDPRGDLSGARASTAAADLSARGFAVTELRGARATRGAVLSALHAPCPDLLHYEGHGAHRGIDGEDAGLRLVDGELGVRDIRGLSCSPRHVVLAACDSARPSGLALSHAFVERGATAVLGASSTLDDRLAAGVMSRLYAVSSGMGAGLDLASALASALRALRTAGGDVAAAAAGLRVITP